MRAWRSLLVGALTGGAGAALGLCLSPRRRLDAGAVELAFVAGAYPAMAFQGHSSRTIALESLASAPFLGLAIAGLNRRSRLAIAGGLLAHAGWDAVHHLRRVNRHAPVWFPTFCMAADVLLAAQFLGSARRVSAQRTG